MNTAEQTCSEIQARIANLCNFEGDDLRTEMIQLKQALLENPAACMLLLPEDIGTMVSHLRKTVGVAIHNASAAKAKKESKAKAPKILTGAELQKALAESDEW